VHGMGQGYLIHPAPIGGHPTGTPLRDCIGHTPQSYQSQGKRELGTLTPSPDCY
jgi:hypothetical protein